MNGIVNRFLLAGDNFIPEMHLKQLRFTNSASEILTKSKKRIQNFKETGGTRYIYQSELDKACSQNDIVEILQLLAKFQTAMVSCSRFIWIKYSSDHRRV